MLMGILVSPQVHHGIPRLKLCTLSATGEAGGHAGGDVSSPGAQRHPTHGDQAPSLEHAGPQPNASACGGCAAACYSHA